ncbi:hypothetical protein, partial [Agrobacterium vitis]|uniref:hypothetical protein n=1 Tax=Agrobacterium vitis TaxID=373 RepID=UPI001F2C3534
PITRTCFALCNPGQRRAIQVLIVNTGVNIGRRYGVNFPRRLTCTVAFCQTHDAVMLLVKGFGVALMQKDQKGSIPLPKTATPRRTSGQGNRFRHFRGPPLR